jgi:hypothetical protein
MRLVILLAALLALGAGLAPETPRHLTVRDYKPRVVLGWTHDGGATTFEIERAIVDGSPKARYDAFSRVGTPAGAARTFRDQTSHPGMTYAYRIRAVHRGAVSPWSTEIVVKVNRTPR